MKPIARIAATDRAAFEARFRLRRPALLRGGMQAWPGTLFDLKQMTARLGNVPIQTYRLPPGVTAQRMSSVKEDFYFWSDVSSLRARLRRWSFGEFLAALAAGKAHYCMANGSKNRKLRDRLAAETGDLAGDPAGRARASRCEFFFGSRGTGPGLHHDGAVESFLCQLVGTKKVSVYSPVDIARLYPSGPWHLPKSHFSQVADSFRPDARRFPLFGGAAAHRCRLEPGDVLYLPPHWYHDPCAEGPSAMMTLRRAPPRAAWGTPAARSRLAQAAAKLHDRLRALPPEARAVYGGLLSHDLTVAAKRGRR